MTEIWDDEEKRKENLFPIDYLISDILQMKVISHNIMNEQLFQYADYLEKRLLQIKKGEIELTTKSPKQLMLEAKE